MKILFFSQIYPSSREPARGPFNFNSFRALSRYCEARVVSPRAWWLRVRRPGELLRTPRESLGDVPATYPTYWGIPRFAPRWNGWSMYQSLRPHVARLRREFPFDVVLAAFAYPDAAAAALFAADYGCPLVTRVMGSDVNHLGQEPCTRPLVQEALLRSQRVIAVSEALRGRMVEMGIPAERIVVLRNAVDGERFVPRDRGEARRKLGLPGDRSVVCYVGRFGHEKGGDVLIDAMARVRALGRSDVLVAMVGGGAMEAALREQARVLGVTEQVRFCGEQPHAEVPDWISACDVLCLPSRREGCPNVVLEALASGRPVVATRVGGVPELLNDENGLMTPSEDAEALAAALCRALDRTWDPGALRATVESLSWDDVGRRELGVMTEVMEEWNARPGDQAQAIRRSGVQAFGSGEVQDGPDFDVADPERLNA
jgi:glycosyltransferase involved in cell wall biosynthesis